MTFFYGDLVKDPTFWSLLGMGIVVQYQCANEWYTNREWFYGIFILYMLVLCIKTAILCNFIRQKWGKNAIEMTKNLLAKIRWHLHPDDCIDSRNSGNRWFLYYLWTLLGVSRLLIGMLSYQISNCFQDS